MSMKYFSDKEGYNKGNTTFKITIDVWNGIAAKVNSLISNNLLAKDFPKQCPDGNGICGVDEQSFYIAVFSVISGAKDFLPSYGEICYLSQDTLQFPFDSDGDDGDKQERFTYNVLDFIEFVYHHINDVQNGSYHDFFRHYELKFPDSSNGRKEFLIGVNEIFERNHIGFKLTDKGTVHRLVDEFLLHPLDVKIYEPGLEDLIEDALMRFRSPKSTERRIALEKIWDAFERLKTVEKPENKKESSDIMLSNASLGHNAFKEVLEQECHCLTKIGNTFQIRHFEMNKERIISDNHIDYLFYRMYSLISLLLANKNY